MGLEQRFIFFTQLSMFLEQGQTVPGEHQIIGEINLLSPDLMAKRQQPRKRKTAVVINLNLIEMMSIPYLVEMSGPPCNVISEGAFIATACHYLCYLFSCNIPPPNTSDLRPLLLTIPGLPTLE